ncbi:MAG TPA: hypothetical protein VEI97_01965 [bacterium]|nr:hypothetical protein [bacterium]
MLRPRPVVHCLIARQSASGQPFDIEVVSAEVALDRMQEGWAVVGPDPDDEIALDIWIQEAEWFTTYYDQGDET